MDIFSDSAQKILNDHKQVPFLDFRVTYSGEIKSPNHLINGTTHITAEMLYEGTDKSIPFATYEAGIKELRGFASWKGRTKGKDTMYALYESYITANASRFMNRAHFDRHFHKVFGARLPDQYRSVVDRLVQTSLGVSKPSPKPQPVSQPLAPQVELKPEPVTPVAPAPTSPAPVTSGTEGEVSFGGFSFKVSGGAKIKIGEVACDKLSVKGVTSFEVDRVDGTMLYGVQIG